MRFVEVMFGLRKDMVVVVMGKLNEKRRVMLMKCFCYIRDWDIPEMEDFVVGIAVGIVAVDQEQSFQQ